MFLLCYNHMISISSALVHIHWQFPIGCTKCMVEHISSRAPFGCSVIQAQTLLLQIPGNILVSSAIIHELADEENKDKRGHGIPKGAAVHR